LIQTKGRSGNGMSRRFFISFLVVLAMACAVSLLGVSASAAEPQRPLHIAITDNYPPYTILAPEGEPFGLFVDMWRLWSETTGIPVEFRSSNWAGTLEAVRNGEADIHSGLIKNPKREAFLDFSEPIHEARSTLYFHGDDLLASIDELDGQRVGVVRGTHQEQVLAERRPGIERVSFEDINAMATALLRGELRAVFAETVAIQAALSRLGLGGAFRRGQETLMSNLVYGAVAKGDTELLATVNDGFRKIARERLRSVEGRWLNDTLDHYYGKETGRIQLTAVEKVWVQNNPVIRLAVTTFIDPVDIVDTQGNYSGLNADLMAMLSNRIGVAVQPEFFSSWSEVVESTLAGKVDGALSFSKAPEREKHVLYTKPYAYDPVVIVTRNETQTITARSHLLGKKVSAVKGLAWIDEIRADVGDGELTIFENEDEALRALAAGRVDAHISALILFGNAQKRSFVPDLKIAGSRNTEGGSFRIAIHNTKTTLFGIMEKALNSLTRDELSALRDKWLAPQQADPEAVLLTAEETLWLKDHPVIDVAMMKAWPPISYVDDMGHPKGVSPALLEALNRKLGGVLRLRPGPWEDNLAGVKAGELPALFDITPLPRRERDFNFTSPYLSIPHVYVARDDAPYIGRERDLAGRTLALEQGFGNVEWFRKNHPSIAVREYADTSEALGAVSRGEADAYAGNRAVARHIIEHELIGNLKVHGRVSKQPVVLAIGVRKDWPILRDILQKALRALTEAETNAVLRSVRPATREKPEGAIELTDRERLWVTEHRRLRVAATPDWPPFEFRDEKGDYKGVTADIIRLVADRAGFDLDIVFDKWDLHLSNLAAGAIDVAPGLYDTPERRKYLRFTPPFVELNNAIYAAVGTDDIHGIDDLDGRRVAVERGYAMNELLAESYPGIELIVVGNTPGALQAVVVGEADAYVGNQPVANYLIRHNLLEGIRPVSFFNEHQQSLHIGVRKDWPVLRDILEKGLASVTEEEQRVIWERWVSLGSAENGQSGETTDARALIFTIGGVAIGFILLLALVREVMRRLVARDASPGRPRCLASLRVERSQRDRPVAGRCRACGCYPGGLVHDDQYGKRHAGRRWPEFAYGAQYHP